MDSEQRRLFYRREVTSNASRASFRFLYSRLATPPISATPVVISTGFRALKIKIKNLLTNLDHSRTRITVTFTSVSVLCASRPTRRIQWTSITFANVVPASSKNSRRFQLLGGCSTSRHRLPQTVDHRGNLSQEYSSEVGRGTPTPARNGSTVCTSWTENPGHINPKLRLPTIKPGVSLSTGSTQLCSKKFQNFHQIRFQNFQEIKPLFIVIDGLMDN